MKRSPAQPSVSAVRAPDGRACRCPAAFTLVELLVSVGIVAVLLGIVLPAAATAVTVGRRASCTAQLRSIGQAVVAYAAASDQYVPHASAFHRRDPSGPGGYSEKFQSWQERLVMAKAIESPFATPYGWDANYAVGSAGTFRCPAVSSDVDAEFVGYGLNYYATPLDLANNPVWMKLTKLKPDKILICDGWRSLNIHLYNPAPDPHPPADGDYGVKLNHRRGANYLFADFHVEYSQSYHLEGWPRIDEPTSAWRHPNP